jgi:hypothetical protein
MPTETATQLQVFQEENKNVMAHVIKLFCDITNGLAY